MQALEITSAGIFRHGDDVDGVADAIDDRRRGDAISGETCRSRELSLVVSPLPSVLVFIERWK